MAMKNHSVSRCTRNRSVYLSSRYQEITRAMISSFRKRNCIELFIEWNSRLVLWKSLVELMGVRSITIPGSVPCKNRFNSFYQTAPRSPRFRPWKFRALDRGFVSFRCRSQNLIFIELAITSLLRQSLKKKQVNTNRNRCKWKQSYRD